MNNKFKNLILSFTVLIIISSCSSKKDTSFSSQSSENAVAPMEGYTEDIKQSYLSESEPESIETPIDGYKKQVERKKIVIANLNLETETFGESYNAIIHLTESNGGYIESANNEKYNHYDKAYSDLTYGEARLVLRIPVDKYELVKISIMELGKVTWMEENQSDATDEYQDIDARLSLKREEEQRLLGFLENTTKIQDVIALEERISNVKSEIITYENRMKNIDSLSAYSTLTVEISEVRGIAPYKDELTFSNRISGAFKNSLTNSYEFLENILIFIASSILPLTIVIFIIIVLYTIYKKIRRKK